MNVEILFFLISDVQIVEVLLKRKRLEVRMIEIRGIKVSVENDVPARYAVRVPVHLSRKQGGTASFSSLSGDEFFLPCKCQKGPADLYLVVKRRKL